jgi:phosphopantothenoylcysteine decarboxylase/phosphopantothenate--cysteine ligase
MKYHKNILLGITGGIAAYKAAELVRLFTAYGISVKVVMTQNAMRFITTLTMQTLSNNYVYTDMFNQESRANLEHIALARWAEAIIVAPGSANFISRLTYGLANDLLSTLCLATIAPIAIAPAMNREMWQADITQENIARLKKRGVAIWGPASGEQACGETGLGRMIEPQEILQQTLQLFAPQVLVGKKVVITAGPTREAIDPVRYISNHSSGKMGYALAKAAKEAGAEVVLLSGPTSIDPSYYTQIRTIRVTTAKELYERVMQEVGECDIFIGAAAVSDYRPIIVHTQKIKKGYLVDSLELELNPDIVAEVAKLKKRPFIVGFAAETENLLENARKKLESKKLDMIVANQVDENHGFYHEDNSAIILNKNTEQINVAKISKLELAKRIIEYIGESYLKYINSC